MGVIIHDSDVAYLRSVYPLIDFKPLTPQQEKALLYVLRGQRPAEAARMAGYASAGTVLDLLRQDATKAIMEYLREREFTDIRVTRDTVTQMFFEAYHKAATAGEMVMATRELAKLHGLYPENKPTVVINAGDGATIELNSKKAERMSDEELLKLAPHLADLLEAPKPIDGSVVSEQ
jgi:hypothetical protein